MRFNCSICTGRGWVGGSEWPDVCETCSGRGSFSLFKLGELLSEDPGTLKRIDELKSKPATAERVFGKLMEM
jgi:hypothetical protein